MIFRLYLITDRKLAERHGGLLSVIEAVLSAASEIAPGSIAIQLREKDLDARRLFDLARALRDRCALHDAPLLVNDRLDIALAADADGVHLPANSFGVADARAMLGPSCLIGVSTHTTAEVADAASAGADFAVFGPVYDPVSKPAYGPARGPEMLARASGTVGSMPLYALGGITPNRVGELERTLPPPYRPRGVAAIGAILDAANPAEATREMLRALATW